MVSLLEITDVYNLNSCEACITNYFEGKDGRIIYNDSAYSYTRKVYDTTTFIYEKEFSVSEILGRLIKNHSMDVEQFIRNANLKMQSSYLAFVREDEIELRLMLNRADYPPIKHSDMEDQGILKTVLINRRLFEEKEFEHSVHGININGKIYMDDKVHDAVIVNYGNSFVAFIQQED